MKQIIGLDIGGTKCAVVLGRVAAGIEIIDKVAFATESEKGFEHTRARLFSAVEAMLQKHGLTRADIAAIGVSCGGPLNSREGMILCPPNLPGWVDVPFVQMLEEAFGVPAYLQNDAKACALVEWKLGAGRGARNMMFLTMGTGMGGGIIAEGQLLCGASDMGGEVGHIRIEPEGPIGFGKAGSFEGFCSGGGIARLAQAAAQKALAAGRPFAFGGSEAAIEQLDTRTLAAYAKQGDADAVALFATVGEKLGKGVAYFIDILNQEVIVIGSIFGRCEALLRPAMEKVIADECISYSRQACRVVPAGTGEAIGDLASVMVAVYGAGIAFEGEDAPAVREHFNRLFERRPVLAVCKEAIWQAYALLKESYTRGGKLLCCGNGGSAADADHIVGELMKGFRLARPVEPGWKPLPGVADVAEINRLAQNLQGALPALSLTQHTALSTAFCNDVSADMAFAQQVYGFGKPQDVLLAISTSGQAQNVCQAAQVARLMGLPTIGLTGEKESRLSALCTVCIRVPEATTAEIQELHIPVYHTLCSMLEAQFFSE